MNKKDILLSLALAGSMLTVIVIAYGHGKYVTQENKISASPKNNRIDENRVSPEFLEAVGVTNALTQEQTEELLKRGWKEKTVYLRFGQFGIGPEMIDALKEEGIDFWKAREAANSDDPAFWSKPEYTAYLLSSADVVVTGEVSKVRYNEEGPYHTEVFVKVDKSLKHSLSGQTIQVNLLYSGVRMNEKGERLKIKASFEPQFKEGERVLLFLSETPRQLRSAYTQAKGRAKGNDKDERLVRDFGTKDKVEQKLQDKSYYEVQCAYKIVNDKAVLKSEALYATTVGLELDLNATQETAQKVRAAESKIGKKASAPRIVSQIPQ